MTADEVVQELSDVIESLSNDDSLEVLQMFKVPTKYQILKWYNGLVIYRYLLLAILFEFGLLWKAFWADLWLILWPSFAVEQNFKNFNFDLSGSVYISIPYYIYSYTAHQLSLIGYPVYRLHIMCWRFCVLIFSPDGVEISRDIAN